MDKTVKVRIAVAVDHNGCWNACGATHLSDKESRSFACEPLYDGASITFVEAELDIPEIRTVKGIKQAAS